MYNSCRQPYTLAMGLVYTLATGALLLLGQDATHCSKSDIDLDLDKQIVQHVSVSVKPTSQRSLVSCRWGLVGQSNPEKKNSG